MNRFTEKVLEMLKGSGLSLSSAHKIEASEARTVFLLEAAYADKKFMPEQKEMIVSILEKEHGMNVSEAAELISGAKEILDNDTNRWRFAQVINEQYSNEEKEKLLSDIWKLAYADGILEGTEEYVARKIAKLLHIPHESFIKLKLEVKKTYE